MKVAIIGCGKIVESNHLPALLNIPDIQIDWIYDLNPIRLDLLSKMYQVPVVTAEEEMNNRLSSVDICLLTIPYGLRKPYIDKCASAGIALYVEKPFAGSLQEHEAYSDLLPSHKLAVGFQRRYYKTIRIIKKIIESKVFGELLSAKISQGYFQLKGGTSFMSDAAVSGGGVVIESAIHVLDQLLYATDATDVSVSDMRCVFKNGIDYDANFLSEITLGNRKVDVECNISCLRNLDNGVSLFFENAALTFEASPDSEIRITNKDGKMFIVNDLEYADDDKYAVNVNAAFLLFWTDFIESVRSSVVNETNGIQSLLTSKWIGEIYQKMRTACE